MYNWSKINHSDPFFAGGMMGGGKRLDGKVALVTGATSGIGRAIALRYVREGARVMCADIRAAPDPAVGDKDSTPVLEALREAGGDGRFCMCDVSSEEDVKAAVIATVNVFERLDIVVANAGVSFADSDGIDEPLDEFQRTVAVNQTGAWLTCREGAAQMVQQGGGGRLILTASVAGLVAYPWSVAYNASKGAAVLIARTLAAKLGPHGITVNAICPGSVNTAMGAPTENDPNKRWLPYYPLGRLGQPDDIAGAAFFLASDDAKWVTGIALPVDGGFTTL